MSGTVFFHANQPIIYSHTSLFRIIPEEDVPLDEIPEIEIPEEDVPLTEIPDEEVPLSGVPVTGDTTLIWMAISAASGAGLLGLGRRRKDDE